MSEHGVMDCGEFSGIAAELALGVLTGRERARALAHLEDCDDCRETVRQLTATGEELVELLPAVEPPPGFETRVMARIGIAPPVLPARPRRRMPSVPRLPRPRILLAAAAATLAVLAAGLGGWGLGTAATPAASPAAPSAARLPLHSATLMSAGGHQEVGQVYFYAGSPRWVYMSLDLESGTGVVTCQLRGPDGQFTTLGWFRLAGGYGYWASPVPAGHGQVTGARIVKSDGTVLATARFS